MKKGIMFILILVVGMLGLNMAGMSETMAGAVAFVAALGYAVLSGKDGDD